MGTPSESEVDPVVLAERNLEDAIRAMADCLEYDWENEWRPDIETLNAAYIRWRAAKQRARLAQ